MKWIDFFSILVFQTHPLNQMWKSMGKIARGDYLPLAPLLLSVFMITVGVGHHEKGFAYSLKLKVC